MAFRIAALQFFDYRTPLPTGTIVFGCTAGFSTFVFHAGADVKALLDYITRLETELEAKHEGGASH